MIKNILKEIIIVIFLCVVITVILGVIFYDYNPIGKTVPSKVAYTTPENIAEELKTMTTGTELELTVQNKVYSINDSDLSLYKKSNTYNPSKENPFADTVGQGVTISSETETSKVDTSGSSEGRESSSGDSQEQSQSKTSNDSQGTVSDNQATGTKAKLK